MQCLFIFDSPFSFPSVVLDVLTNSLEGTTLTALKWSMVCLKQLSTSHEESDVKKERALMEGKM